MNENCSRNIQSAALFFETYQNQEQNIQAPVTAEGYVACLLMKGLKIRGLRNVLHLHKL
jgi:hypothetical protein